MNALLDVQNVTMPVGRVHSLTDVSFQVVNKLKYQI